MSYLDIKTAMRNWLVDLGYSVIKVASYDERVETGGHCETCSYIDYYVDIYYINSDGKEECYDYCGNFAELIRELTADR